MRRVLRFGMCLLVALNASVFLAEAQPTGSSLRGYVKDNQGGVLPGVTVTATSPNMITSASSVTDETGYYRLINLPPGEYAVTAELQGFRNYQRSGIKLFGGVNFQVDIVLDIGAVADLPSLAFALGFDAAWHPFEGNGIGPLTVVGRRAGLLAIGLAGTDPPRDARRIARWATGRGTSAVVTVIDPTRRLLAISVTGHERPVASIALDAIRAIDERILERGRSVRHESPLAAAVGWADALAGQSLGDRFFEEFRDTLEAVMAQLPRAIPARDRHALGLLALTRVLFLYFVQERGWLDGRPRFLREELDRCLAGSGGVERKFLHPLFFGTLNRAPQDRSAATRRFGRIPFLNGGLFEPHRLETRWSPQLPDDVWRDAFDRLFERYHFTIAEDDPCRSSIGPDMLGRVFERVMNPELRRDSGAFYTPSVLVDRLVDRGLAHWLASRLDCSVEEARARVERGEQSVTPLIETMTVLDPAVGSGAFLLGALKWLVRARKRAGQDTASATRAVVRGNLFGVDRNPNAVRLTELRLWLAVIQADASEEPEQVAPLPNLDALVRQGDSVIDPVHLPFVVGRSDGAALAALRQAVVVANGPTKRRTLDALRKAELAAARTGFDGAIATVEGQVGELLGLARSPTLFETKPDLNREQRAQLAALRVTRNRLRAMQRRLAAADEVPWFHFASHFADVIGAGGFDVVVGNPPWVRAEQLPAMIRDSLKTRYRWFRAGATAKGYRHLPDLSVAFLERALELTRPDGMVIFLVPAKLLTAQYAATARQVLASSTTLHLVAEVSAADGVGFDAMVYPLALIVGRRAPGRDQLIATGFEPDAARMPQRALIDTGWRHATEPLATLLACLLPSVSLAASDARLVEAVQQQDAAAVRALLKTPGIDVNARTGDGATALHWAAHRNALDIMDALLTAGAALWMLRERIPAASRGRFSELFVYMVATAGGLYILQLALKGSFH